MRNLAGRSWITLLLVAACGGSGGAGPGAGGNDASAGSDASSGACANLACLHQVDELMRGCAVGGACTFHREMVPGMITTASCYADGVTVLETIVAGLTSGGFSETMTYQVKKGGAPCFTRTFMIGTSASADGGSSNPIAVTTQDGSGTTLATVTVDSNNVATATCPGGQPTVVADACGISNLTVSGPYLVQGTTLPACTDGTCSF